MKLITIILLSLFISSCSTGQLMLSVKFPNTPVLSEKEKIELKRNIAIKNAELFTDEELESLGVLEVVIR